MNSAFSSVNKPLNSFWTQRLRKHGHTGWADQIIYAFDQPERLKIIGSLLSKLEIKQGLALDFGCGTGDFSRLLLSLGFEVCGYDPFVQPNIPSKEFAFASTFDEIPFHDDTVDLVLTVTTLDHLNEEELRAALSFIRKRIKCNANIYFAEYALDSNSDRERFGLKSSDYQVFRTLAEWARLLLECSFRVLSATPLPQPLLSPSMGFLAYKQSLLVQMVRRCPRFPLVKHITKPLLRWQALKILDLESEIATPERYSPLKLLHCAPN